MCGRFSLPRKSSNTHESPTHLSNAYSVGLSSERLVSHIGERKLRANFQVKKMNLAVGYRSSFEAESKRHTHSCCFALHPFQMTFHFWQSSALYLTRESLAATMPSSHRAHAPSASQSDACACADGLGAIPWRLVRYKAKDMRVSAHLQIFRCSYLPLLSKYFTSNHAVAGGRKIHERLRKFLDCQRGNAQLRRRMICLQ